MLVSGACLDVDLFSKEEPAPLRFCPTFYDKKTEGTLPSAWVLLTMKEILYIVGLSCEGFEEELLALFGAIEASHSE
jgi:hypothetical protein